MRIEFPTTKASSSPVRALVIQMGARRDYEVARMLEAKGALSVLHTDAAWPDGAVSARLAHLLAPGRTAAIRRRTVRGVPASRVTATFTPNIVGAALTKAGVNTEWRFRVEDFFLGFGRRLRGFAGANTVISVAGNGGIDFLRYARCHGLKLAADVVITPLVHEILAEEHARWPDWDGASTGDTASRRIYREYIVNLATVCHRLICPSDFVAEGLSTVAPFAREKIVKVPYSLGAITIREGQPEPRRILFAGEVALRKGIPYLARAAELMKGEGVEVLVAGWASEAVRARPAMAALTFLGHLPGERMAEELSKADVFCLPSLAEGMASVTLEALAHGVPCVVTPSAGAPVTDGVEGRVVPERDPDAIAAAIMEIVGDRTRRANMSAAATRTAKRHAPDRVAAKLHAALETMHESIAGVTPPHHKLEHSIAESKHLV